MRIALALAVSLAPALSAAKCAHAYLGSLPAHDTPLPANGLVWLEAFGADQPVVAALEGGAKAGERAVAKQSEPANGSASAAERRGNPSDSLPFSAAEAWLEGAGGRVPLTAKFVNVGSFNLTQTVLQPSKPLKEGQTYALVLTRDGKAFRPTERVDGKDVPTTWKVGPADEAPPVWTGAPVITERTHVEYGCGPAIEVAVKVPVEGAFAIEVTLQGPKGTSSWWLPVESDGSIRIGHGMCSGAFDVSGGAERVATLVAVDAAGNRAPAPEVLRFAGVVSKEGE